MILGLNAYTYCSAMALYDGGIECCAEEERFNREKKTKDFPSRALLEAAPDGFAPGDVECIAYPWHPRRLLWETAKIVGAGLPASLQLLRPSSDPNGNPALPIHAHLRLGRDAAAHFHGRRPPIAYVPHHLAHAALAFFGSPFDEAVVLVADGFGDDCSISAWLGRDTTLRPLIRNRLTDSLGILYSCVTLHLGYATGSDEGKVMALAALGTDRFHDRFAEIVAPAPDGGLRFDRSYVNWHKAGELRPFASKFVDAFGPARGAGEPLEQRHYDLASALQHTLEESVLHIASTLRRRHGVADLALAGGVMLNCTANGRLARESGFERVFVPPNPDDGGAALGAAMWVHHGDRRRPRELVIDTASYGSACRPAAVRAAVRGRRAARLNDPAETAAALIADGHTVGWCEGRMEMGPRALGHRSLLADPRRPEMKHHLNQCVKHREGYRPYAPSILEEEAAGWFPGTPPSPFMNFSSRVAAGREGDVPAVLHVDGTARLQTVSARHSPTYHALIRAFERRTGVPMVLNTSLNDQEPICRTAEDAVRCFDRTELDALVVEDQLLLAPHVHMTIGDRLAGRTS
jgi:carbamoyltransferase